MYILQPPCNTVGRNKPHVPRSVSLPQICRDESLATTGVLPPSSVLAKSQRHHTGGSASKHRLEWSSVDQKIDIVLKLATQINCIQQAILEAGAIIFL